LRGDNTALPYRLSFEEPRRWFQHTWDSSSLGTFLRCPRRYFYQSICGFSPVTQSVDLFFGTLVHKGMEVYHEEKPAKGHNEAQVLGLEEILSAAWIGPTQNQCAPVAAHMAAKYWRSTSNNKNLWNALRAFIWHTEVFGFEPEVHTAVVGGSLLAVELPFQFDLLEFKGTPITYCGHMDRIVDTPGGRWVVDYKTTTKTLGTAYFSGYEPSTQLPGYAVAAKIVFHQPIQGVMIDAFQIGVDFVRCGRGHILMTEEKADEWLYEATTWIRSALSLASQDHEDDTSLVEFAGKNAHLWPRNTESCFICPFKVVCSSTPSVRKHLLAEAYVSSFWDPLARQQAPKAEEVVT